MTQSSPGDEASSSLPEPPLSPSNHDDNNKKGEHLADASMMANGETVGITSSGSNDDDPSKENISAKDHDDDASAVDAKKKKSSLVKEEIINSTTTVTSSSNAAPADAADVPSSVAAGGSSSAHASGASTAAAAAAAGSPSSTMMPMDKNASIMEGGNKNNDTSSSSSCSKIIDPKNAISDSSKGGCEQAAEGGGTSSAKAPSAAVTAGGTTPIASATTTAIAITTERQKKIVASILHRRQLLSWVRTSRIESQRVRDDYSKGTKRGFISAILLNDSSGTATAAASKQHQQGQQQGGGELLKKSSMMKLPTLASRAAAAKSTSTSTTATKTTASSSSSEIADFQTITAMASKSSSTSLLKRKSSFGGDAEAASRELRRGSSVGKRMSAAVTTLNSNVGGAGWGVSSSSNTTATSSSSDNTTAQQPGGGGGPIHPSSSGGILHPPSKIASSTLSGIFPSHHSNSNMKHQKHGILPNQQQQHPGKQFQGKQFPKQQLHHAPPSSSKMHHGGGAVPYSIPSSHNVSKTTTSGGTEKHQQKKARKRSNSTLKKSTVGMNNAGVGVDGIIATKDHHHHHSNQLLSSSSSSIIAAATAAAAAGGGGHKAPKIKGGHNHPNNIINQNHINMIQKQQHPILVPSTLSVRLLERRDGLMVRLDGLLRKQQQRQQQQQAHVIDGVTSKQEETGEFVATSGGGDGASKMMDVTLPITAELSEVPVAKQKIITGVMSPATTMSSAAVGGGGQGGGSAFAPPPTATATSIGEHKKGTPSQLKQQQLYQHQHHQQQRLPPRRKTQWDCVLEEMKWMATDFIEERKWKMAVGQSLSISVKQRKPPKKNKMGGGSSLSPTRRTPPRKKSSSSTPRSTSSNLSSSKSQLSIISNSNSNNNETLIIHDDDDPLYVNALSNNDVENVKKISQLLSVSILDHWDAPLLLTKSTMSSGGGGGGGGGGCYKRHQKLKEGVVLPSSLVETNTAATATAADGSSATATANDAQHCQSSTTMPPPSPPKLFELGYDEISQQMEESIDRIKMVKEQQQRQDQQMGQNNNMGVVELWRNQLDAVHFIEQLWEVDTTMTTATATTSSSFVNDTVEDSEGEEQRGGGEEVQQDEKEGTPSSTTSANNNDDTTTKPSSLLLLNEGHNSKPSRCGSNNVPPPAILIGGGFGTGKTIAICSLLWKNSIRKDDDDNTTAIIGGGPQLVVCSPGALIRWTHELKKFNGLNPHIYGRNNETASYGASDVVVCDYTSFLELAGGSCGGGDKIINFVSLVLDLRHPSSLHDKQRPTNDNGERQQRSSLLSPIVSVKWWICLNNFISSRRCSCNMKRLIMEQTDLAQNRFFLGAPPSDDDDDDQISSDCGCGGGGGKDKGGKKKRSDEMILAMKVAFVYHPSLFYSERDDVSIGKRVISWAKRHAKKKKSTSSPTQQAMGKEEDQLPLFNGDDVTLPSSAFPSGGYRQVLSASLQSMCDFVVDLSHADTQNSNNNKEGNDGKTKDSHTTTNHRAWELRMCSLAKSQKAAYDQCCSNVVRGRGGGSDEEMTDSLLKLRKICIHSNLDEITASLLAPLLWRANNNNTNSRGSIRVKNGSFLVHNSATFSEPNLDAAKRIVKKSTKMNELLRVLVCECGYDIARKRELIEDPMDHDDDDSSRVQVPKKDKVKVLILATLVEAQLLTSFFLSAVGLHHEVLVSLNAKKHGFHPSSHSSSSIKHGECSWAWSQDVLSQFNHKGDVGGVEINGIDRSVDILIASPKAISSQSGGIGASSADAVISIDEDWSGREALHVMSILTKIRRREGGTTTGETSSSSRGSSCKFIKLVCQNTCEDTFLCKGNIMKADGTKKSSTGGRVTKRETLNNNKRGRVGTRRSTRAAASKTNQDETSEALHDKANNCRNSPVNMTPKPTFLCQINVEPRTTVINSDGFILPPAIDGELQTRKHSESDEHHLIGSNVVRYRNDKLSSVLCAPPPNSNSDQLFMPTKGRGRRTHHAATFDCDLTFVWALFNSEDNASCMSATKLPATWRLRGVDFALRSISLGSATSVPISALIPASAQCYVESFRRTPSFTSQGRSKKQMRLLDQDGNLRAIGGIDALVNSNPDPSSREHCRREAASVDNNVSLLVYKMPNHVSRKRKISDVGLAIQKENGQYDCSPILNPHGEFAQSIFSFCFSSCNSSATALVQDGNQGCEPLLFFPAFLPSLIQTIQKVMYSMPQVSTSRGMKRKGVAGQFDGNESKRLRISGSQGGALSPNALSLSDGPNFLQISSSKTTRGLSAGVYRNDPFSFSVETNPFSIWDDRNEDGNNVELVFNRRLLAADLEGLVSCQSRPSLNSMILITHKKRQLKGNAIVPGANVAHISPADSMHKIANQVGGKRPSNKKIKKHHPHPSPLPLREKCSTSYFQNDHLFARSYSARDGMKFNFATSLIGRVRLQRRLNDLVSNSFAMPAMDSNQSQFDQAKHPSQLIGPVLLGTIPSIDKAIPDKKLRSQSGITLPVGVKAPRLAKTFSSSLEESSEPWTEIEDSVLRESLSRYGMNWQLTAHAVSSGTIFVPALVEGGRENSGNVLKRSPTQCQSRWTSLKAINVRTISSSSGAMMESENPSSGAISSMASVNTEISRFVNEVDSSRAESIIYDGSSSIKQITQEPSHTGAFHWLGTSKPASIAPKSPSPRPIERTQPLISRIQILKEVSKKRRVATTPMPSSAPMHPSHSESIHAARASMLSAANGVAPPRNEMWPLELLDYVKKNKATANQPSQRDAPRGSTPHSAHPSSQSPHRQQSSVPYHPPPHNVHPSQHQMYHGAAPPYQGQMHHAGVNPTVAYQSTQPRIPRHHHHRPKEPKKGST